MARLSLYLPPAAGDYSGAASVLFGLDCLVVLVDAGCCTRNYTEYDEPRWERRRKTAFSAQLRTLEATLGDESRIIEQTADMARELGVSCIALLGTPVPAVTGMDLAGIACEVEDVAGVPTLGIETNGFETYERGASKALTALLGRFVCDAAGQQANQNPARSPEAPHVNILGLGPQDFLGEDDMNACVRWFEDAGAVVDFVTSSEYTLADVARAGAADLSVVVAWSGLEAARLLKERFGVPYVVGRPWCVEDAHALLDQAQQRANIAGAHDDSAARNTSTVRDNGTAHDSLLTGQAPGPACHNLTSTQAFGPAYDSPASVQNSDLACDNLDLAQTPGLACNNLASAQAPDPACDNLVSAQSHGPACEDVAPAQTSGSACEAATPTPLPCSPSPHPLLIIGEQIAMNSLRSHIRVLLAASAQQAPAIAVATRFSAEPSLSEPGDLALIGETELIAWARAHPGFAWIGDPLFSSLPGFSDNALVALPHEATSSTLYAEQARQLAGRAALEAVESAIMARLERAG